MQTIVETLELKKILINPCWLRYPEISANYHVMNATISFWESNFWIRNAFVSCNSDGASWYKSCTFLCLWKIQKKCCNLGIKNRIIVWQEMRLTLYHIKTNMLLLPLRDMKLTCRKLNFISCVFLHSLSLVIKWRFLSFYHKIFLRR